MVTQRFEVIVQRGGFILGIEYVNAPDAQEAVRTCAGNFPNRQLTFTVTQMNISTHNPTQPTIEGSR